LVLSCEVHGADVQDRDGAKDVLTKAKAKYPTIVKFLQMAVMPEHYKFGAF
jgi:hypothetical protein